MDPERKPPVYPLSLPSPTNAPADGNPSVSDWLAEMRAMRKEARDERKEQTRAFVEALDGLGTKLDNSTTAVRGEMKRHLMVLSFVFLGSFVVLAGLAGASIWLKFGPVQGGTTVVPTVAPEAPAQPDEADRPVP